MSQPPLVSIVIANYNYGRFLAEAIDSALGQSRSRVEVVVVDDGSTDESVEVASRFPVALVRQENCGVCAARHAGVRKASGDYLVFLDADDALEPEYVSRCLAALEQAPPGVAYAYTGVRYFGDENGIKIPRPFDPSALLHESFVNASALIRRSVFESTGGFDTGWTLGHEDRELWIQMLSRGYHGILVPEPLLRYRKHKGSRNDLSRAELRQLRWRLRLSYPRLYWAKLLKDPIRTVVYWFRFRGKLRRNPGLSWE